MSVTNESTYVSFYIPFLPKIGSLHQPSPTVPEATGLCTYRHTLHISMEFHHSVLHIHSHYPTTVISVSAKMWLVLPLWTPYPFVIHWARKCFYPQDLGSIHKQSTTVSLFESSSLHKKSIHTVLFN